AEAVRELAQSGLNPSNCRLLDAAESALTHAGPPGKALLVLGFESAHPPVDPPLRTALAILGSHSGEPGEVSSRGPQPEPRPGALRGAPAAEGGRGSAPGGRWRH